MLYDRSYMRDNPYRRAWPAVVILIVINTVVFVAQLLAKNSNFFERHLALTAADLLHGKVWQLVTFQFLHSPDNLLHIILNCAMLFMFGRPVEDALGRTRFTVAYLSWGAVGGLAQVVATLLFPRILTDGPVMGASAGVFGVIAAFAALNWEQPITTLVAFILPVTMRAKYLILVASIIEVLWMLSGDKGVAHVAHLGGIAAGLGYIFLIFNSEREFFNWSRFRRLPRPRELVPAQAPRRGPWQPQARQVPEDLPPAEFISREVDPILDKISAHGIQSLTDRERRILEAARAKMSKR